MFVLLIVVYYSIMIVIIIYTSYEYYNASDASSLVSPSGRVAAASPFECETLNWQEETEPE